MNNLDILVFAAHPDDAELAVSGTILSMKKKGFKVGVVDLTRGELGSRGSAELRDEEAAKASEVLGLDYRSNLRLEDGWFLDDDKEAKIKIIQEIRAKKPKIVLANAISDRHPDHGKGSKLVSHACFLSGLRRIETTFEGEVQEHWRPTSVYHYIQDYYIKPDFVFDITEEIDQKIDAIKAFGSQFFDPTSTEPHTPISGSDFVEFIKARAREMGRPAGFEFAEGFTVERFIGVNNLFDLI